MKWLSFLKVFGKAAVTVATNPISRTMICQLPFGNLGTTIVSAIVSAQEKMPAKGAGDDRARYAMDIIQAVSPGLIGDFEKISGKSIMDEDRFALGIKKVNDGYVDIMKSMGMLQSADPDATPATQT